MLRSTRCRAAMAFAASMLCAHVMALPVIPGGVGYGIETPAGRGGEILRVTNLNASGPGSLRACVEASGPRICVFEVSGVIRLTSNLTVSNPNLTIAGQTAPDPGIMIRGATLSIRASDVLVQHIAVRVGDHPDGPSYHARDSLSIIGVNSVVRNVVIDHCSFSWALDETVELWDQWDNVTISNTIISQGLRDSLKEKPVGLGMLIGAATDSSLTMVGNLMAHAHGRNPRSGAAEFVLINNVVYNAGGAEGMLFGENGVVTQNAVVGNVFIAGHNTSGAVKPIRLTGPSQWDTAINPGSKLYLDDNRDLEQDRTLISTSDPWSVVDNQSTLSRAQLEVSEAPVWPSGLRAMPSGETLEYVLANAGTRPAARNDVDAGVTADVSNGTGRIINCVADDGTARCAKNAGGWPQLASNTRRLTLPEDPNGDDDGDGYSNVEEWLHVMAAQVEGREVAAPAEPSPPKPPRIQP